MKPLEGSTLANVYRLLRETLGEIESRRDLEERRNDLIREALRLGATTTEVAEVTGLTAIRIRQIRSES